MRCIRDQVYLFVCRLRINQDEESKDESNRDSDNETEDPQHTREETHFLVSLEGQVCK